MKPYVFMTDSDSDLPYSYVDKLDITMVYMPYIVDGKEFYDDLGRGGKQKEYFDAIRAGATPVTSLLPQAAYVEYFEPCLKEGKDILFVAFSSKLSSTINNIYAAREEMLQKYPDRKLVVVDTLSISAAQSILILKAYDLYNEGKSIEEVAAWLDSNKTRAQAWFTVDDLKYLRRGGRIGAVAATVGTMLDLKPIIVESKSGNLVNIDKVQGRKRALRVLADKAAENIDDPQNAHVIILHADMLEDAARVEALIRERIPALETIETHFIGSVIGAHCGPGTVAVCFFGKERAN